ncbi:hypothetical protein ACSHSS_29500, partial [Burkholderia sp. BC1]
MATEYRISPDAIRLEIARLQWANALMRAANKALAKGDKAALNDMGFSIEHADCQRRIDTPHFRRSNFP